MMHDPKLRRGTTHTAAPSILPPLTAADYLQLRRKAARLSVEEVARRLAPKGTPIGGVVAFVRLIETPRTRLHRDDTLLRLQGIFRFDPAVYRQLTEEPADRHPQVCRSCGCSHWDMGDDDSSDASTWSSPTSCTRCVPEGSQA